MRFSTFHCFHRFDGQSVPEVYEHQLQLTNRRLGPQRRAERASAEPDAGAAARPNTGTGSGAAGSGTRASAHRYRRKHRYPANGALTSAVALAGFYRQLIASRVLTQATLTAALDTSERGQDRILSVERAFGLGFMRPALTFLSPEAGRESAFGHTGVGGSIGFAGHQPRDRDGVRAIRMSDEVSGALRAYRIIEAIYESIG